MGGMTKQGTSLAEHGVFSKAAPSAGDNYHKLSQKKNFPLRAVRHSERPAWRAIYRFRQCD